MRRFLLVVAAVLASACGAFGWSDEWSDPGITNDFDVPPPRMFMELVWAVNERLIAAQSAACSFFEIGEPGAFYQIFPGEGDAGYLVVTTNFSDEVGEYVATTSAVYRAEFWEPNAQQMDALIDGAYRAVTMMTPAPPSSFTNRYRPLAGATSPDPSVPLWAYMRANEYLTATNRQGVHELDRPMDFPWNENPVSAIGGRMAFADGTHFPVYLVDYPVHEHPPGATLTNQVLKTFTCELEPYAAWHLVAFGDTEWTSGTKADWGNYECDDLRIAWDGSPGWWTNSAITFRIHRAMTDVVSTNGFDDEQPFWRQINSLGFITGYKTVKELFATNALEVTGTLPIHVVCSNFVPYDVDIVSGGSFTGIVPNVVARINGIRPSGYGAGSGSLFRSDYSDWNPSMTRLLRIKNLLESCENRIPAKTTVAITASKTWTTNSTWYHSDPDQFDCDDAPWLPGWGRLFEYTYTNTVCETYDYESGAWVEDVAPAKPGYYSAGNDIKAAEMLVEGGVKSTEYKFSADRRSYRLCLAVEVGPYYASSRFPRAPEGYPRMKSCAVYLARTNLVQASYGWPTNSLEYYGSATFSAGTPTIKVLEGDFVLDTDIQFNADDDWLDELNSALTMAYVDGPYDCTGTANSSRKAVHGVVGYTISGIAEWAFTEDFTDYWDMYPACTNMP